VCPQFTKSNSQILQRPVSHYNIRAPLPLLSWSRPALLAHCTPVPWNFQLCLEHSSFICLWWWSLPGLLHPIYDPPQYWPRLFSHLPEVFLQISARGGLLPLPTVSEVSAASATHCHPFPASFFSVSLSHFHYRMLTTYNISCLLTLSSDILMGLDFCLLPFLQLCLA
jgi:hypothetical protein